jgi:hypothetical protein
MAQGSETKTVIAGLAGLALLFAAAAPLAVVVGVGYLTYKSCKPRRH